MFARSPLHPWLTDAELYYRSVTAHGTTLGYVFPTLIAMGLGYAICATALARPIRFRGWAWAGFWLLIAGAISASVAVASGHASVLYTFYPPLTGSPFYYIGVVLVVAASWVWCGIMFVAMAGWKRQYPGHPVPLAMFATVANAILWAWTTAGVAAELLIQVIPAAF